jgi:hypothetical protein
MKARFFIIINTISLIAVLIINYLSNSLPLNGKTPGQLSDEYVNLFVPSGATFAIWGVIYTWLIIFAVYQVVALFSERILQKIENLMLNIGWLFTISCGLNIAWIFAWHWQYLIISLVVMVLLFITLLYLNRAIQFGKYRATNTEKWIALTPFGIYWGWISVALIANTTAVLVAYQWTGFGMAQQWWAITMIITGALIACAVVYYTNHIFYGLAVVWALYGIHNKRVAIGDEISLLVAQVALSALVIVFGFVIFRSRKWFNF